MQPTVETGPSQRCVNQLCQTFRR